MKLKRIVVLSREQAFDFSCDQPYLLVSICDPGDPPATPVGPPVSTVHLQFLDIDTTRLWSPEALNHVYRGMRCGDHLVQPHHARSLTDFLSDFADVETVVVHCHAGLSRSPSTAMAIADAIGLARSAIEWAGCPKDAPPNRLVYDAMYAELRRRFSPERN